VAEVVGIDMEGKLAVELAQQSKFHNLADMQVCKLADSSAVIEPGTLDSRMTWL
jgi:hypothetical protein